MNSLDLIGAVARSFADSQIASAQRTQSQAKSKPDPSPRDLLKIASRTLIYDPGDQCPWIPVASAEFYDEWLDDGTGIVRFTSLGFANDLELILDELKLSNDFAFIYIPPKGRLR